MNPKKISVIAILILGLIAISIHVFAKQDNSNSGDNQSIEIVNSQNYYDKLTDECKNKESRACCLASIKSMKAGNYTLTSLENCPSGYRFNMLKCRDSYRLCEPIKNTSQITTSQNISPFSEPKTEPTIPQQEPAQKPTTSDTTEYPYILKPLSQTKLSSLRSEFEASNGGICAQIDEYGFTVRDNCFGETTSRIEITDENSIVEMIKDWLIQNSKFTGITNKSDALVDWVGKIGCCELKVEFHAQTYRGIPVEGAVYPPTVFADARGILRIDGYWLPEITVPLKPKISEASARNKLNGRTFTYGDIGGRPIDYRVEQKDLSRVAHKVVFVKKSSQGLEFRLAWKISVGQEGESWTVYIDAVTGEELKVVQMFQT